MFSAVQNPSERRAAREISLCIDKNKVRFIIGYVVCKDVISVLAFRFAHDFSCVLQFGHSSDFFRYHGYGNGDFHLFVVELYGNDKLLFAVCAKFVFKRRGRQIRA